MIRRVTLSNFKKFKNTTFELAPTGISFLAGGNNSGKSTLLQALAVWEFGRVVLEMERGREALEVGYTRQGLGISDDEFSPVSIASLKHLWTNLKTQEPGAADGYSLGIECEWTDHLGAAKHLKISMALANDRLFLKAGSTNLAAADIIPTVAYLPPFAGIGNREGMMSGAERRAMVGRGLSGGIIRNLLHDLHAENEKQRATLKAGRSKIKNSDLARLRNDDAWEILQQTLGDVFKTQLEVSPFNAIYHTYIKVSCVKGSFQGTLFKRHTNYNSRDLMAEGSGFLQWLSVYALALDPKVNVILLDEPDAHLHPSLQSQLIEKLFEICQKREKQVLLATHSTEILRWMDHNRILAFRGMGASYLADSDQKISLFLGLGSDYAPKLDPLRKGKRLLIVENKSDERMLKAWATNMGLLWPESLVTWPWTGGSAERKQLFLQLKAEIGDLRALSIRDRDDMELEQVDKNTLRDKSVGNPHEDLMLRVWRRRHIENYILHPASIASATGVDIEDVDGHFADHHALVVPQNFPSKDVAFALIDARGKEISQKHQHSIKNKFGVAPEKIAQSMNAADIPDDVKTIVEQIVALCA